MIKTRKNIDFKINNLSNTFVIKNSPASFKKRFNSNEIDFNDIIWLYWDWDDWCQYWEIIPSDDDIKASDESKNSTWSVEALSFLKTLK